MKNVKKDSCQSLHLSRDLKDELAKRGGGEGGEFQVKRPINLGGHTPK